MKRDKRASLFLGWAGLACGSIIVYVIFGLVLMFLFERQPSSFIYVSF